MHLQGQVKRQAEEILELRRQVEEAGEAEVSLDLIDKVPGRQRKLTPDEFQELKANLARNPLLSPIVLERKPGGRYDLVAGHNRVDVYRELGRTTIRSTVVDVPEGQAHLLAFFSNLIAPALPDFEKYLNFKQLQVETGLTQTEIAEAAGLTKQHVSRIMQFDGLPEQAKAMLESKPYRLGSTAAQALGKIAEAGNAAEVVRAVEKLMADDSVTQEQVVALARPTPTAAPKQVAKNFVVKDGRRNFCDITAREGGIGIKFPKGFSAADSEAWAEKIHAFIKAEMDRKGE